MAIPDYQTLMRPVLEAAVAAKTDISIVEIAEHIAKQFGLNEEELDITIPSGTQPLFYNRLHWAKTYLSKAGLLQSPKRGKFRATAEGEAFLSAHPGPISSSDLAKIPAFEAWRTIGKQQTEGGLQSAQAEASQVMHSPMTPDDLIDSGLKLINDQLTQEVLNELKGVHPKRFEAIVVDFLKAMGFGGGDHGVSVVTPYTNDGGVDGIIHEDALGLDSIYIQAKRYTDKQVGQPDVQQFVGSMDGFGAHKGVFVTTSTFSKQAHAYVEKTSKRVVLIDGERLASLFLQYGVGVRTKRTVEIKAIDPDYFLGD
ncbi:restriction endonuclease [Thermaurantiacus sp.]